METDEEILDWVAKDAETALHPSCTARMGVDDDGGRSTRLRCGCTASTGCASSTPRSIPYVTNGNIYAPVMMVAEKAADLILGQHPAARRRRAVLPLPRRHARSTRPATAATGAPEPSREGTP